MKPLIVFHGNCTDGFTAAWVAARALGDVELFPAFYGQPPPDVTDRDVYILDFSYKRPVMEEITRRCASLVVIDHHKTAKEDLYDEGGFAAECPSVLIFDMEHSGAALTWWHFHRNDRDSENQDAPALVRYVEDRDLWRWALPDSRLISAAIECVPRTLEEWDALAVRTPDSLIAEGAIIERYRGLCIEAAMKLARPALIGGHRVVAANSSEMRFASDTAGRLAEAYRDGQVFAATYWIRQDGNVQFSLRSREGGLDVSQVAENYGGGGHPHAAGFETDLDGLALILRGAQS